MDSEWLVLSRKLIQEPHLLHSRTTPEILEQTARDGRMAIRREGGVIISCAILWTVPDEEWFELGTVWVEKDFRGNGLCKDIFLECIEKRMGRSLFLITAHHGIKTMVSECGWSEELADWTTVPLWKRIADPWGDRYPTDSNIKAPGKLYYLVR